MKAVISVKSIQYKHTMFHLIRHDFQEKDQKNKQTGQDNYSWNN